MNTIMPTHVFLTKGKGQHKEKLASLEQALRMASIAPFNLIKVSSIFPPNCKLITRSEGAKMLRPGQILFVVMSENSTNEAERLVSAAVGLAIPNDPNHYGYLSEHHAFGQTEKESGTYAEDLAAEMLATTLGKNFNVDQIWKEERQVYQISPKLSVRARNITQTARGAKGLWTTTIAAAVFVT